MHRISAYDVVFGAHKARTERANRVGWLIDEAVRAGEGAKRPAGHGRVVARPARFVAAVVGALLALPLR
jgi:hypothetical protein